MVWGGPACPPAGSARGPDPAVRGMPERTAPGRLERRDRGIPAVAIDGDLRTIEADHIEGVVFAARAGREGAGLNDQRGVPVDSISLRRVPDVADVEMTGEKHIGAGRRE